MMKPETEHAKAASKDMRNHERMRLQGDKREEKRRNRRNGKKEK